LHGWLLQVNVVTTLGEKQPETEDLLVLDTDELFGHLEERLSRVLRIGMAWTSEDGVWILA
jgi:hypothetical protein